MKHIKLLILLPFFLSCNNNHSTEKSTSEKLGIDTTNDTYAVTTEDSSMNAAISKAKITIDEFDMALKSNNPLFKNFSLKKRYITPDGGGEHMWIAGIKLINGNYHGYVNNDAERTTEVKYGDTVIVRKDEITDWMYLDNNVLRGGYTIREIRNQMTKEERISMDKGLGFKIED
jgi:uncharacterized protein YegJ (DUF2314 family)